MSRPEVLLYHHGRFAMAGGVLPDGITAYRTYGDPKNPAIVFPTCYTGRLDSRSWCRIVLLTRDSHRGTQISVASVKTI